MVRPSNPDLPGHSSDGGKPGQRQVHFILQRRYEVVSHLGQGGMGTVYMARDLRLANRFCVVKKLRDDFFREEDKQKALEFFNREAMVLSPLKHPNIVSITDYFEEAENYYLVMEYVEGENLYQMMTQRDGEPFTEEQVLKWAVQIADVLHFLHSNDPKVIYRDLKPSNVMIDTKDRVKLVDFGIARPYAEDSDNTHVVSAGYSPPEQYWGAADPRSDIYALGATMHYLLTGQEPLALQTCSPKKSNPNVSEHADLVVQRATAQDVWLRYQNAAEMLEDLAVKAPKSSIKAVQIAAAVVGLLLVIGFGGYGVSRLFSAHSDPKSSDKTQSEIAEKNQEIKDLKKRNQEKDMEILRAYQSQGEQPAGPAVAQGLPATTATADVASQPLPTTESSAKFGTAFREMDEAQLTDTEGLAPLEEDSSNRPKSTAQTN